MSPGSVTEKLYFFVGEYQAADRVSSGGGKAAEGEDIDVIELSIDDAMAMIADGTIRDAKTIMLLQYAAAQIFGDTHGPEMAGQRTIAGQPKPRP